ncbi:hypothetical protein MCUN1_001329 [Malassezia cuniculi]|uniref:Uncharacterized protein n=1 Tax=Malassezia cuniculi TaxID=948313 RepID=A0AAF0EPJ5_9BASI|nr:hypothetical protein MCUN1_001329 [Malassezia cuniculi]
MKCISAVAIFALAASVIAVPVQPDADFVGVPLVFRSVPAGASKPTGFAGLSENAPAADEDTMGYQGDMGFPSIIARSTLAVDA